MSTETNSTIEEQQPTDTNLGGKRKLDEQTTHGEEGEVQHQEEPASKVTKNHVSDGKTEVPAMSDEERDNDVMNPESKIWLECWAHTKSWINLPVQYLTDEVLKKCVTVNSSAFPIVSVGAVSIKLKFDIALFPAIARKNGWKVALEKFKPNSAGLVIITPPLYSLEGFNPIEKPNKQTGQPQISNNFIVNFGVMGKQAALTGRTKDILVNLGKRFKEICCENVEAWGLVKDPPKEGEPRQDYTLAAQKCKVPVTMESNFGFFKFDSPKANQEAEIAAEPKSAIVNVLKYKRKPKATEEEPDDAETVDEKVKVGDFEFNIKKIQYEEPIRKLEDFNGYSYDAKVELDSRIAKQKSLLTVKNLPPALEQSIRSAIRDKVLITTPKAFWSLRLDFYRYMWSGQGIAVTPYVRQMNEAVGTANASSNDELVEM